jgi:hypothetical protein
VALLARRRGAAEVTGGAVLDGHRPSDVLHAMEAIADALLEGAAPGDQGARMLESLGLFAAGAP